MGRLWVAAFFFAWVPIVIPRIQARWLEGRKGAESFGKGTAVTYTFMILLPELDETHRLLGDRVHLVILAGFLVYLTLVTQLVRWMERRVAGRHQLLGVGLAWVYHWLLLYAIPDRQFDSVLQGLVTLLTIGIHLMFHDAELRDLVGHESYDRWARWALAAAPITAWVMVLFFERTNELLADLLTASLAGILLYETLGNLGDEKNRRIGPFLAGSVVFLVLTLLAEAVL